MTADIRGSQPMRLARTVVQLRPAQVGQRLRLRAQRSALARGVPLADRWLLAGPPSAAATGWPDCFAPLDALAARGSEGGRASTALRAGTVTLLGVSRPLAPANGDGCADWSTASWDLAEVPLLWRYHLYYWDWAWALAQCADRGRARAAFASIWQSWRACVTPGQGAAWHPYPAALRAWSFCGLYRTLAQGSEVADAFLRELSAHLGILRRSLETDVGGNHLIKNLKALCGLAVFFSDEALLRRTLNRLVRQLSIQVLPDGGHYERAPAYHCQVLGDLIDIAGLLAAAGYPAPAGLAAATAAMRGWLGAVVDPGGDVPLLNDGFPVDRCLLELLGAGPAPAAPLHLLPDTGLARITAGGWHVLADVGLPCPRELPAHAHADSLGCVAYLDGAPLLVDTGTSGYAPGPARDRERSTAAHNTAELDGTDSTEVWGAFRAGRRARVHGLTAGQDAGTLTVEAAHDGYRSLPGRPVHRRKWTVQAAELRVDDEVTGRGRHQVTVRWHLAPGSGLRLVPGGAAVACAAGELTVAVTPGATGPEPVLTVTTAPVSTGFAATVSAPVLSATVTGELPVAISTVWRRTEPAKEPT